MPEGMREFDDADATRRNIYGNVLDAMKRRFPVEDDNYRLELLDIGYDGPQDFSLKQQKNALLRNRNLRTNLLGTWRLTDKRTGQVLDERRDSVMQVPYWTNRGTIINNGSEYTVISQSRLRPGVYARRKSNGEYEAQFNIRPGTGRAFHFGINPETGVMTLRTGQGQVPLYQVLRGMGVDDREMIRFWGADVTAENAKKQDAQLWNKLYSRMAGSRANPQATEEEKQAFIKDALARYEVDPEVVERTMGLRNVTGVTPELMLRASQKLLNLSRGDEKPDNRDNPRFSKFYGPEDYFKERIEKNAGRLANTLLFKARRSGSLKGVQRNALNPWVDTIINGSGLAMPGEEANPLSTLEQMSRISKFGMGGIGSKDAVTMEARDVQGDYLGFVDQNSGPECFVPGSFIMSKHGYVRVEDVALDTELACMVNGRLEYHRPERVIAEDYDGLVYCAESKLVRYRVTPNHRIWHRMYAGSPGYRFRQAAEVHGKHIMLQTGGHAPYVSENELLEFVVPHVDKKAHNAKPDLPSIDMETWGAFLGWFLSEGNVNGRNVRITQRKHDHLCDLVSVLDRLPCRYCVFEDDFIISDIQLASCLKPFGHSWEKRIPEYMFEASVAGRTALLNALCYGDGRRKRKTYTYCTISHGLALDVERLCFSLGLSANVRFEEDHRWIARRTGGAWAVHINTRQERQLIGKRPVFGSNYFTERYSGKVYCVTVPGGMVYARYGDRGGHWTGNSEAAGVDVRASYKTFLGRDNKLYGEFIDNRTGKKAYVDIATASDRLVAFPGQDMSQPWCIAMKDGVPQRVRTEDVRYTVPSYSHMLVANTNMNPMPTGVQSTRQFYGSKFWSQYLPQAHGEVPLVDSLMPDGKMTWSEYYGRKVGTLKAGVDGTVVKVDDDGITIKDELGKTHVVETVKNLPFNRLSAVSYYPSVEVGQKVKAGDMVAHSNYTDKKTGSINMGQNLRAAILPWRGWSYEDAYTISEDAAKRLATDRLYSVDHDAKNGVVLSRDKYVSAFPSKFTKEQVKTLDEDGIVKAGTVLHRGDPIVVSIGPKLLTSSDKALGKLSKVLRSSFTDRSETWEHDYPGTVVDAVRTPGGAKVSISAQPPVRVGDKLCYDPETEVLTLSGWKRISEVSLDDGVATLDPDTGRFEYIRPELVRAYEHHGGMYRLESQQLDVMVTPNHNMYVQKRGHDKFGLYRADEIVGKRVSYKKDGEWVGDEPEFFTFPAMLVGHRWGTVLRPEIRIGMEPFLVILGMFLSEGSCINDARSSTYGIAISQKKRSGISEAEAAFKKYGIKVSVHSCGWDIYGAQYLEYFRQFGHAQDKYIPEFVFGLSKRLQRVLLHWLMWGDGHSKNGRYVCYTTVSRRLADDVQRLCLHCGYAANVVHGRQKAGSSGWCEDHLLVRKYDVHDVRIITDKLTPTVNHGHVRSQHAQSEGFVEYDGMVYCCTMPKWNVIYVRRNGKPYWCGNSPFSGLKGVVGRVIPSDQMPRDATTNEPYEVLINPMGFLSRVAPNQLIAMNLAKVAKATGKQIRLPQLPPPEGWYKWAKAQMDAAGVKESADVFDPESGRTIRNVGDGYVYLHAFHHLAEKKVSARGADGAYTQDDQPAKGGSEGAKRNSGMDLWAMLAHNVPEVIKDTNLIRGTRNDDYWRAMQLGLPVPEPDVPFIYKKFLNTLRAGGVNVTEKGSITKIMPQTDKDVEELAQGRVITSSDLVDPDFDPVKGGLFDLGKTGGMAGNQWSMIKLPEPVPNPIMEEPVRRVLGLTVSRMEGVLSGTEKLDGKTGGQALKDALAKIDVDKRLAECKENIASKRGAARDDAIKQYRYLSAMKKQGLHPQDWMISNVPVIPPVFRPVSKMGDVALVSDLNELYKDVIENARNFEELRKDVDDDGLVDERLNIYNSVKAAYGLGEPITPENAAKGVKGAIRQIIGNRPKFGQFQSKVLSKPVGGVSRGVISPDPNLDMDQCGLPEDMAWPMYKPYVMRQLVQHGYPATAALKMIEDRTDTAKSLLEKEMAKRPVILDRAPTWHKFNLLAFMPHLTDGNTIRVSPLITAGFTADFDGDQMNAHVPSSEKAVRQTLEKMLPSRNLTSLTDLSSPRHMPSKEQIFGLYALTKGMERKPVRVYNTVAEAKRAYAKGEIGPNDPVEILRR